MSLSAGSHVLSAFPIAWYPLSSPQLVARVRDAVLAGDWLALRTAVSQAALPGVPTPAQSEAVAGLITLHPCALPEVMGVYSELECVEALKGVQGVVRSSQVRLYCVAHVRVAVYGS